jgi:hypothetical protein
LGAFPALRTGNRAFRSNSSTLPQVKYFTCGKVCGISASIPCAVRHGLRGCAPQSGVSVMLNCCGLIIFPAVCYASRINLNEGPQRASWAKKSTCTTGSQQVVHTKHPDMNNQRNQRRNSHEVESNLGFVEPKVRSRRRRTKILHFLYFFDFFDFAVKFQSLFFSMNSLLD